MPLVVFVLIGAAALFGLVMFVGAVTVRPDPLPPPDTSQAGPPGDRSVQLEASGDNKILVIKILREATGLGLKEAKDMAEGAPVQVRGGMAADQAEALARRLNEVGARASVR